MGGCRGDVSVRYLLPEQDCRVDTIGGKSSLSFNS